MNNRYIWKPVSSYPSFQAAAQALIDAGVELRGGGDWCAECGDVAVDQAGHICEDCKAQPLSR